MKMRRNREMRKSKLVMRESAEAVHTHTHTCNFR